ncbi:hypothetical protein B0J13DRAFT_644623 [Dactylonectria estremocensis]|uniref:Secreted protein n=1 Tax=Dactylonectria estremocensis TaxID=1079267 RepID=A0A9P9E348_9HYPO|nr:hypothetical protein B0J13DRAFT_644623 [Dactylonectria estremocensis]
MHCSSILEGVAPNGLGTFSHPEARVRPRFRYWLPDASVDVDVVVKDIASAASIGAGGVEFIQFFEYGGDLGSMPPGANWSTYNFGTPAFNGLFKKILEAHEKYGLVMDFALGPNQGQGVPAKPDDEGLQWDMIPFTEAVLQSGLFAGTIPGWGTGDLVSLVSALVKSNKTITYQGAGIVGVKNITYDEYRLVPGALSEHTSLVDKRGLVKLSFPRAPKGSHYRLFAFYERLAGHKNLKFNSTKHTTIFDDGSYAVDHFSPKGAAVVSKFWKENILKDGVPELLARVGNYAYGSAMDMLAAVPAVDAPECESLSFEDNLDSYRSFSGPARLVGRRVVSNEMGALRGRGLQYHLPQLIFSVNRAFLGGVNQNIIHGQTYSGSYYATTWPGYTPFRYLFTEPWSPKLPAWSHGLQETMDYIARVQHILQKSVAKADVVIYNKESATTIRTIYQAKDLLSEGWSWNYLSADNLRLTQAMVNNGILASDGPAWKAFVVETSQNVTLGTVKALASFAGNGLPVVFSGGLPKYYAAGDGSDAVKFERELSKLLRSKNVHSVASGKVADKLRSLGLRPRVGVSTNGTCYTSWSEADGIGYALVYSDLAASTGYITVTTTKAPFYLNPWTGEASPVLVYKRTKTTTAIPINLAGNQTILFAFGDELRQRTPVPRYHVEHVPSHVLGSRSTHNRGISLHVARSDVPSNAILSDGKSVELDSTSVPPTFQLSKWTLTAEHWEAPEDLYDSEHTVKYNTTHQLNAPTSWSEIPSLANASGIGYYTTTFQWPPRGARRKTKSLGAYISFSRVLDAATVTINDRKVPALDITNAVADISPYLRHGQNTISVTVPTTLWNYLRTIISYLVTAGSIPLPVTLQQLGLPLAPRTEAGLVGTVTVIPYQVIAV